MPQTLPARAQHLVLARKGFFFFLLSLFVFSRHGFICHLQRTVSARMIIAAPLWTQDGR